MNRLNVKKFLTWEEKFALAEEIKEYVFYENKYDPYMKEKISKIMIAKYYADYSDIVTERLAEDNEDGFIEYMEIGKTYNRLITDGLYSDIVFDIDEVEYESIIKLIDDVITENNREMNSLRSFMEQFSVDEITKSIENLNYDKIDKLKAITDKL